MEPVFIFYKVEVLQKVSVLRLVVAKIIETKSDVLGLKISVNDPLETKIMLGSENLPNNNLSLFLRQDISLLNKFLQVTVTVFK